MILQRVKLEPGCPHPAISSDQGGVRAPRLHNIILLLNLFSIGLGTGEEESFG